MAVLELSNNDLLEKAKDERLSTENWAKLMHYSRSSRSFFNERLTKFHEHRNNIELAVKATITVTLGVGLFCSAPATLLFGAAAALALSSLVFGMIQLGKFQIAIPELKESNITNFDTKTWEAYRTKWSLEAENHGFTEKQKALHTNMIRTGMAIVIGFAAFTGIASGMAIPLCVSTILYAAALFYQPIHDPAPYFELEELPALSLS